MAGASSGEDQPVVGKRAAGETLPALVGGAGPPVEGPAAAHCRCSAFCGQYGLPGAGGVPAPLELGSGNVGQRDIRVRVTGIGHQDQYRARGGTEHHRAPGDRGPAWNT